MSAAPPYSADSIMTKPEVLSEIQVVLLYKNHLTQRCLLHDDAYSAINSQRKPTLRVNRFDEQKYDSGTIVIVARNKETLDYSYWGLIRMMEQHTLGPLSQ